MAGDVRAFAILAWEVRTVFVVSPDKYLNGVRFVDRFSLGDLRSPTGALSRVPIRC